MRVRARHVVAAPRRKVLAALHDLATWHLWFPGAETLRVTSTGEESADLHMVLRGPRLVALHLDATLESWGVRVVLVEGDVSSLSGQIRVTGHGKGQEQTSEVELEVELAFAVTVPLPLVRELETETPVRWLSALERHVTSAE